MSISDGCCCTCGPGVRGPRVLLHTGQRGRPTVGRPQWDSHTASRPFPLISAPRATGRSTPQSCFHQSTRLASMQPEADLLSGRGASLMEPGRSVYGPQGSVRMVGPSVPRRGPVRRGYSQKCQPLKKFTYVCLDMGRVRDVSVLCRGIVNEGST